MMDKLQYLIELEQCHIKKTVNFLLIEWVNCRPVKIVNEFEFLGKKQHQEKYVASSGNKH